MRARRIALALWVAWAVIVWNVVFDHIMVVAGRTYLHAAAVTAQSAGPYARMDDWMRPAATRGLWTATAAGTAILLIGLLSVRAAARTGFKTPQVRLKPDTTSGFETGSRAREAAREPPVLQ